MANIAEVGRVGPPLPQGWELHKTGEEKYPVGPRWPLSGAEFPGQVPEPAPLPQHQGLAVPGVPGLAVLGLGVLGPGVPGLGVL